MLNFFFIFFVLLISSLHAENKFFLTLESALTLAANQNRQLLTSADSAQNSLLQVSVMESEFDIQIRPIGDLGYIGGGKAGTGPAVGSGLNVSKKNIYGTRFSINPAFQRANNEYKTSLTSIISQPLLRGFGKDYNLSNVKGAQYAYRSNIRSFFISQSQIFVRTIASLYEVLKAQKSVSLNTSSYERVKKFFQAAQLKAKLGVSDPLDIYRAEIEMRHAEDALKASEEHLEATADTVRDILALPPDSKLMLELPLDYNPEIIDHDQAVLYAQKNRVELAQAMDQQQEMLRMSHIAKEKLLPEINLVFNFANTGNNELFTSTWDFRRRESTWGVGFTTSTDFNQAASQAAYDQSLIAYISSGRNVDQVIGNLTFEVKRSIRNLERSQEKIVLQAQQIQSGKGELRLAQIKFDRGMGNNFDMIQAEKSLRNAELAYLHALIDFIVGQYQFIGVLGMLVDTSCL